MQVQTVCCSAAGPPTGGRPSMASVQRINFAAASNRSPPVDAGVHHRDSGCSVLGTFCQASKRHFVATQL